MTVGTRTYEGRAVPLKGESNIVQETLGTDIITITGAASQTGDFLVCRNSSGTEKAVITKDGVMIGCYNGTSAPDTTLIPADGGFAIAVVSGTSRMYFRANGTVKYVNADG